MSHQPASRDIVLHGPSLADAIAAIGVATLPLRRRQDMASALRTLARVLQKPAERIPADPRQLAPLLSKVAPQAHAISRGRWNNVRSLARAALALIQPMSPGRQTNAPSAEWKLLQGRIKTRSVVVALSRLLRFLSAKGIAPERVCARSFQDFRVLLSDALLDDPDRVFIRTIRAWKAAQTEVPDWPRLAVEVPDRRGKWTLRWDSFPTSLKRDFDSWATV